MINTGIFILIGALTEIMTCYVRLLFQITEMKRGIISLVLVLST